MSDEKKQKNSKSKTEKPQSDAGQTDAANPTASYDKKSTKAQWTLARCKKFARRFSHEKQWAEGAPSSYKAAVSRGWFRECASLFKQAAADHKTTQKKAAPTTTKKVAA